MRQIRVVACPTRGEPQRIRTVDVNGSEEGNAQLSGYVNGLENTDKQIPKYTEQSGIASHLHCSKKAMAVYWRAEFFCSCKWAQAGLFQTHLTILGVKAFVIGLCQGISREN